jgi:uncharacterized repeat protein (TIGR01451 family)
VATETSEKSELVALAAGAAEGVNVNVRRNSRLAKGALLALGAPLLLTGLAAPANAATTPPAGAYAEGYGLMADLTALQGNVPLNLGTQGDASTSCPPTGGTKSNSLLDVGSADVVHADALTGKATTDCSVPTATGTAHVVAVDALGAAAQVALHVDAVTATSTTSCTKAPTGSTYIANLSIGGTPVISGSDSAIPPNTEISGLDALGLRIILNEQHPAADGRGLVVNGIHIIASGNGASIPIGGSILRGDIVISHAVSGVVCPGGPGTDNGGLPKPDIRFSKSAAPSAANPGDTVVYTATFTNQSAKACEVMKAVDHVAPAFDLVSTAGPLGTAYEKPAPKRTDGGVDAVLRPTNVTIGAGKSVTQTFTVQVKADAAPGTYYDTLELYCGLNGDYISGPLAPVTVPAATGPTVTPNKPVVAPPAAGPKLAATGGVPALAVTALLVLAAAFGIRRLRTQG